MVFSRDEKVNKAFVCAGVPDKYKQLNVTEWLKKVLDLINGKGGGGKGGLAQGQVSNAISITCHDFMDNRLYLNLNLMAEQIVCIIVKNNLLKLHIF